MRKSLFFCFFLIGLALSAPLSAQPFLYGHLFIDSVQGSVIDMRLEITNIGNQSFDYTFGDTENVFYSIDGTPIHGTYMPVVLPWTLEAGETQSFDMIHYDPLSPGEHVIQAFLNVDLGEGPLAMGTPQTVFIGWPFMDVTAGAGDLLSRVPIDFYWRTSLYESLFSSADLNYQSGYIRSLTFNIDFAQTFYSQHLKIYLGNTSQPDLSAGWTDSSHLLPVFDGWVTFPVGEHAVEIPLAQDFFYNGGNLALRVFRPIHSSYQFGAEPFRAQAVDSLRVRKSYSDYLTYDPLDPPAANPSQHVGFMPQTTFRVYPGVDIDDDLQSPAPPAISCRPNPLRAGNALKILSEQPFDRCEVFNLRGQKLLSLDLRACVSETEIPASGLPCGIYFLRVFAGDRPSSMGKFAVVR